MSELVLHVGNRNYSSWSLRAYLAAAATGAPLSTEVIPLDQPETRRRILALSPAGRVPILVDGDVTVWDSLAIGEHLAERFPAAGLWPADPRTRARARSVSAEMHAGFPALRAEMPMNLRARRPGVGHTAAALADAERVMAIWRDALDASGGPLLFGGFTIADAMYAPVTTRFTTYGVELDDACQAYVDAIAAWPAMRAWTDEALREPWTIAADER